MCRFIAYQGEPVLIADLLYRPRHSLVRQSMSAEQMSQTFNADGFGIGFYTDDQPTPCVVRSTVPAWANRGLENLAYRIHSRVIFGHVRAASHGVQLRDDRRLGYRRVALLGQRPAAGVLVLFSRRQLPRAWRRLRHGAVDGRRIRSDDGGFRAADAPARRLGRDPRESHD